MGILLQIESSLNIRMLFVCVAKMYFIKNIVFVMRNDALLFYDA